MLTLGDLLEQREFGLTLLAADATARDRPIAGAHNSETPNPSRFLAPDWLMLTLGIRLRGSALKQRELVGELDQAGVCALGFGVGVSFCRVPRALLREAASRGFPVFEIPYETPYREIVGFVNRSLLSPDTRILQQSLSMQNYLMDALRDDRPVHNLVSRLGHLLRSTVLLFNHRGELESASGDAPVDSIWEKVQDNDVTLQRALVADSDVVSLPIVVDGQPSRRLVLASRDRALPNQLVTSVLQSAERLLGLIALNQRAMLAEERVLKAELLTSALDSPGGYDSHELATRARRFGLDFTTPARVYVLADGEPDRHALARARHDLELYMEEAGTPYLMASRSPHLVALIQDDVTTVRDWLSDLAGRDDSTLTAGAGPKAHGIDEIQQSYRGARTALRQRGAQLRLFEEIGLASWLLSNGDPDEVAHKLDTTVSGLVGHPRLRETLSVYLEHNANVQAAARALNIHHNTLRYRLSRAEEALGRSLSDLSTLADLHLVCISGRLY